MVENYDFSLFRTVNSTIMSVPSLKLSSGQQMPIIGLGTWNSTDPVELETVLSAALDVGYRHIDTAFIYNNEEIIGKVLKKWFDGGKLKREDLFVTTKFPMMNVGPEDVTESLKTSLTKLGLDYVDLYLIHFPILFKTVDGKFIFDDAKDHVGLWKEMEKQVEAGRTKAIGISNFSKELVKNLLDSKPKIKPANNQIENHVFLQQQELVKFCQNNGITVTAYSPLGCPGYNKAMAAHGMPSKELPDMLNDATIKKIARAHNKTNAQVLLRYQIQRNVIVIPKTVTVRRLIENFDVFDFNLTKEEMKILDGLNVGEAARICDSKVPGIEDHPLYPYKK